MKNFFTLFLLASSIAYLNGQPISQCDIGIDTDNTHLSKIDENRYSFRTVIHHPNGGNDDDARMIHCNITIPISALPGSNVRISKNDQLLDEGTWTGKHYAFEISSLSRNEFVEVYLEFNYKCGNVNDYVSMNVWPQRPNDVNGCNNTVKKKLSCYSDVIPGGFGDIIPDLPRQIPLPIDEICKYVLDCPGCGVSYLCHGELWQIPYDPRFEGFEILEGDNVVAATKSFGEKGYKIKLPKINNSKKYFVRFF